MTKPIEVADGTFEQEVLQASVPVLVDFWAPWCGPCRMVAPLVEELAQEYEGRALFTKLNVDDSPAVAAKYGIRSIPTVLFFKGGKPVGQVVGAVPKKELKRHLEAALS